MVTPYQKLWYEANKERILEKNKLYRKRHDKEVKEQKSVYYELHKEYVNEKSRKYREEHKEKLKEYARKYHYTHGKYTRLQHKLFVQYKVYLPLKLIKEKYEELKNENKQSIKRIYVNGKTKT